MNENCLQCGRKLVFDEVALHRKLINRGAKEFMCLSCMAKHFNVTEEYLKEKIDFFRRSGCTLF